MKSQPSFIDSLNQTNNTKSIFSNLQLQPTHIKCSGNQQAYQYCFNNKCRQSPIFTCFDHKCNCNKQHILCPKASIEGTLSIIHSKIYQASIKDQIQKTFDKLIDQLSELRDNLLNKIQSMKYANLEKVQQKLLKISKNQLSQNKINNQQAAQLWKIIVNKYQSNYNVFEQLKKDLIQYQNISKQHNQKLRYNINNYQQSFQKNQSEVCKQLIKKSLICKKKQSSKRVIQMFKQSKTIKSIQLVYRASQNQFDLSKFHNLCGNLNNIIILTLTDKDKIFGGYTYISFGSIYSSWIPDSQKKSFLFSINQNQKFSLSDCRFSLYSYSNRQSIQMGSDFLIANKANINKCRIGNKSHYINNKYNNDKESYLKLNGNETAQCYLKQWQVFKIQFQQN